MRTIPAPDLVTPRRDPNQGVAVGKAMQDLGGVLTKRAEELQAQHDLATTQSFVQDFRSTTREKLSDLLTRRGKDAKGSIEEYQQFYDDESGTVRDQLENGNQKIIFDRYILARRESDLDSLSSHQAVEHKRHLEAELDNAVSRGMEEAATANVDAIPRVIADSLTELDDAMKAARSGTDYSAEYAKDAAKIIIAGIEAAVQQDPQKAREYVELSKEALGPSYPKVKDIVDREATLADARELAPEDFDAQEEYVSAQDELSETVKESLLSQIRSDRSAFRTAAERERQQVRTEAFLDPFFELMAKGDFGSAFKHAEAFPTGDGDDNRRSTFTEQEKLYHKELAKNGLGEAGSKLAEKAIKVEIYKGDIKSKEDILNHPMFGALNPSALGTLMTLVEKEQKGDYPKAEVLKDLGQAFLGTRTKKKTKYMDNLVFQDELSKRLEAEEVKLKRELTPQEAWDIGWQLLEKTRKVKYLFFNNWLGDMLNPDEIYRPIDKIIEKRAEDYEAMQEERQQPWPSSQPSGGQKEKKPTGPRPSLTEGISAEFATEPVEPEPSGGDWPLRYKAVPDWAKAQIYQQLKASGRIPTEAGIAAVWERFKTKAEKPEEKGNK